MYLKSLTLKGFKSFADRTHLTFDPGLNVVVGPNGSGKSNVSDAVLWVLGEQSAKQLRGQAMEDVIFSGSSARKPVGVAEVTLVLDNEDRTLPIDFSEVGITRRMYRSGESEYLINGAPARLMDIQDILHDSGLGKDTHSIISQGKLEAILQSRPEERRALVEEAAGISKHKRRKERSLKKLASMDESITRAKDVSREIARQLHPLERQVDKAKRYNDLSARLSELTCTLAVDDLRRLQRSWGELQTKGKEAEASQELARYRLQEKSRELEKLQSMLEQKGLFVGDLGEQRRRMQSALGRIDSDMRLLEEKGRNMVDRLSEMRMTLSTIEKQRSDASSEAERVMGELSDAKVTVADLARQISELEPQTAAAIAERKDADERQAQLTLDIRKKQREADEATLAHAKLKDAISNAELEDSMFEGRLSQIDEALATATEALDERDRHAKELASALDKATAARDESHDVIERAQAALAAARTAEDDARKRLSTAKAQLGALASVDRAQDQSSPLVARVCGRPEVEPLVECRLDDLLQAPADLEGVVERLLGEELGALIVSDDRAIAEVVRCAVAEKGTKGRLTVLSRAFGEDDGARPARGERLVDLLDVREDACGLVNGLLGRVAVVDDARAALDARATSPDWTYLTRDGATLLPDGRCQVGTAADAERGTLERKRRIRDLERGMDALEKAFSGATEAVQVATADLASARDAQASARGEVARVQAELGSVKSERGRLEAQVSSAANERAQLVKRREAATAKATEARPLLEQHKATAAAALKAVEELMRSLDELADERSAAQDRERELTSRLSEARLRNATVSERRRHLEVRSEELSRRTAELDARRNAIEESSRSLDVLRLRIDPLHERYEAVQTAAVAWAERLRDRASLEEADSDSLKKTISDAKSQVAAAQVDLDHASASVEEAHVASGKLEVQVQTAIAAITADGTHVLEEALELPEPEDRDAMEREAAQIRGRIESLGPVNQVAMDEYSRLKERADYIDEQLGDLERARTALAKITAAIDRKMRRQFLVTFDAVNRNFQDIFGLLFPGGQAHLEMTDPDHPADTGIEVVAQPRGKHIMKMTLMSGGEKSLTALALLFAVYRTRTVPFYIFDEVEAALDDSNLDKLLTAIEQLKESTQLVVISHQRRTMEQADVLYGVSMQADGVSHVVSQRLDRATGKVVDV